MMMINKINELKNQTQSKKVKDICESAIATLSSTIYNNVPQEAKDEIEKTTIDNLFEQLSKFKSKEVSDWVKNQKRLRTIQNIGVKDSIKELKKDEAKKDPALNEVLDRFSKKLEVVPEVLLYEEYISALQSFKYFPTIDTAVNSINHRVNNYKTDIDITKILETMKQTKSSYLVPLIEDVVYNYLNNKNKQTKHQLKETLMKFTYDDFVRDIVNAVTVDAKQLQLEHTNAACDIEDIYSPVMYIGENEAVFNVKGNYFIKKGNNINKLPSKDHKKLNENFRYLCETLNSRYVVPKEDLIEVYYGKNYAKITESSTVINDKEWNDEDLKNAAQVSQWSGDTELYEMINTLKENFNEIAIVDFAKRVSLKENENYGADIFRLRDKIFINTTDPVNAKNILYRNINPIQAKNLMMEHLNFDISESFKDILPNEEKIHKQINETKQAYIDYIKKLEDRINEFKNNPYTEEVNEQVINALQEELEEVKGEYKDYVNRINRYLKNPGSEKINEDLSLTINIGDKKYTVPLPDDALEGIEKGGTSDDAAEEVSGEEDDENEFGTVIGSDKTENEPASAVTFDDSESALYGNTPTNDDAVDLGGDEAEAEAEAMASDDDEEDGEETGEGEEGEEVEGEEGEDEFDFSEEGEGEEEEEKESDNEENDEEDKVKKEKSNESSIEKEVANTSKKVFLKKKKNKKNESLKESRKGKKKIFVKESHLDTRTQKINFISRGSGYTEEELKDMPEDEIHRLYIETEDKIKGMLKYYIDGGVSMTEAIRLTSENLDVEENIVTEVLDEYSEEIYNGTQNEQKHSNATQQLNENSTKKDNDKKERKVVIDKKFLNENISIGDKVKYKGQRGYVTGKHGNNVIVQLQHQSKMIDPKDLKQEQTNVPENPQTKGYHKMGKKYDIAGEKIDEALQNQMVKCGIYVGNTPVKDNKCYVNFKSWNKASKDENISVMTEGKKTFVKKENVRILESIDSFANSDNYVEGVELNAAGEAISNVLINAIDYTHATGNADEVRIIRGPESENPELDYAPKANLKTLAV
ncbi:MAG: hypothetical protein ACOC22_00805 [bacterium]